MLEYEDYSLTYADSFFAFLFSLIYIYYGFKKNPEVEDRYKERLFEDWDFILDVVILLKKYKSKERWNSLLEDRVLIGIFWVLYALFDNNPEHIEEACIHNDLLNELFNNCLF